MIRWILLIVLLSGCSGTQWLITPHHRILYYNQNDLVLREGEKYWMYHVGGCEYYSDTLRCSSHRLERYGDVKDITAGSVFEMTKEQ